jgi:hypothetical protein
MPKTTTILSLRWVLTIVNGWEQAFVEARPGRFWWIPISVGVIVWLFGLKGAFGDYMLMAIPRLLALPLVRSGIGLLVRRRDRTV